MVVAYNLVRCIAGVTFIFSLFSEAAIAGNFPVVAPAEQIERDKDRKAILNDELKTEVVKHTAAKTKLESAIAHKRPPPEITDLQEEVNRHQVNIQALTNELRRVDNVPVSNGAKNSPVKLVVKTVEKSTSDNKQNAKSVPWWDVYQRPQEVANRDKDNKSLTNDLNTSASNEAKNVPVKLVAKQPEKPASDSKQSATNIPWWDVYQRPQEK